MRNVNYISKKAIFGICTTLVLWTIGARAAISSPEPDNAALLYYQAFILRPQPDNATYRLLDAVLLGAEPNEKLREYLNLPESRETIRIAEAATQIPQCSWGIMRSQGIYNLTLITLIGQLRQLAFLLELDARTLAVDGEYRAALERCLSIRRFAQHFVDEANLGYLASMPADFRALRCIQYVLGSMPPDRDTLIWLQGQISTVQGALPPPGKALEITLDDALKFLSVHPEYFANWRENVSVLIEDESARQEILSLTDEELLERAKESYNKFLSSVNRVIGSDMLYQQKYLEIQELEEQLEDHAVDDPVVILRFFIPSNVAEQHDIYVGGITVFNVTKVAIEIYLVNAETGQLPETLPANLPKDPFSGQEFEYNVSDEGFVISFDPENLSDLRVRQYEFPIA